MPELKQHRNDSNQFGNGTASFSCSNGSVSGAGNGFWSKHRDDVSYSQLQKFWSELSLQERRELLRIDKQTLFEQARKNIYCSRCNGLLLEAFLQIVMYGKSFQQEIAGGHHACNRVAALINHKESDLCKVTGYQDDIQDPSVHPWGGLTTTRDGMLTLMGCYLYSKSLKGLQNVFDSARARERERELLYPDACGGGGRGWISQGMAGYGRGHGTRETCALHTAKLSVDTLVVFWSELGEDTQQSLLRMKEEDFIERLMYRFDSKRFCRDCRRNVIREFKELKELKRMRKEPHCTNWFCVADTAFQYEVSHDTVQADWHHTFIDTFGTYHHFEWAIGTGEGKSDILEFENVGLSRRVHVTGLDLHGLNLCYITLRAWKMDGRCTELSVKAHALKGQRCVHCRLVVGDGFITISRGESIRRFFEHAEEAEDEEDDDSMDKDGNELDGECSRPQKHAKSPELAREFLLDAATVIFKEQVEKAFREGTARQNAHSIFVCLALKLLEERVHVACKEIITLEKQMKLLDEEEKEKREEEERKERKRNKEREKKLRRKERLKEKERDKDKEGCESNEHPVVLDVSREDSTTGINEDSNVSSTRDSANEIGEAILSSPYVEDDQLLDEFVDSNTQDPSDDNPDMDISNMKEGDDLHPIDNLKFSCQKLRFQKDFHQDSKSKWPERRRFAFGSKCGNKISKHEKRHQGDNFITSRSINGTGKQVRSNGANSNMRNGSPKIGEKFYCSKIRMSDRYNSRPCSCNQQNDYRAKVDPYVMKVVPENKSEIKRDSKADMPMPYYHGNKYNTQAEYMHETCGRPKSKNNIPNNSFGRGTFNHRKVWEPMESQKYPRDNSDSDSISKVEVNAFDQHCHSPDAITSKDVAGNVEISDETKEAQEVRESSPRTDRNGQHGFHLAAKTRQCTKDLAEEESELSSTTRSSHAALDSTISNSSNSDNCLSCLSEGDSNAFSSNSQNVESSCTSDSEDSSQNSEGRENSACLQNGFSSCQVIVEEKRETANEQEQFGNQLSDSAGINHLGNLPTETAPDLDSGRVHVGGAQPQIVPPSLHNQSVHYPIFQAPNVGYYHQTPVSWPVAPANGLMPFSHPNHYVLPSPLGYGLNGNTFFMQYGALQHLTPPLLNHGHMPLFQPVAQTNSVSPRENAKTPKGGPKECHHEANLQKVVPSGGHPREALKATETGQKGKYNNSCVGNTGFSLFHFGVPVATSTGSKSNPVLLKEGIADEICRNLSADHTEVEYARNKKNCIEEYNLFAASNGIKFSFSDIAR